MIGELREEFRNEWRMYRRREPLEMVGGARVDVRYAVSCNPDDGTPHIFRRKDFLLSQAGDPDEMYVDIRCPRNVRFAPDDEDLDPRQWAHSTLLADRFFDLYEAEAAAEASGEVLGVHEG